MPFVGVADLIESVFHLANPATTREAFKGFNQGVLLQSGVPWTGYRGMAGEAGRRLKGGLRSARTMSFQGAMPITIAMSAVSAAMAPRGHKASAAAAYAIAGLLSPIPGGFLAGTAGAMITGFGIGIPLEKDIAAKLQYIKETGQRTLRLHMGGGYVDTDAARTMRQRAAQDMSGSLMNARQYLGKEGALLHS